MPGVAGCPVALGASWLGERGREPEASAHPFESMRLFNPGLSPALGGRDWAGFGLWDEPLLPYRERHMARLRERKTNIEMKDRNRRARKAPGERKKRKMARKIWNIRAMSLETARPGDMRWGSSHNVARGDNAAVGLGMSIVTMSRCHTRHHRLVKATSSRIVLNEA